jgi:hypothetical protein
MSKFLIVFSSILLLSACSTSQPTSERFTVDELYQGYPCRDYCDSFQKGYDAAVENGIIDAQYCIGGTIEEVAGCKAFVADFKYENQSYEQFIESL